MSYIEPCCIENQLPPLIKRGTTFFQTNGDVTLRKLLDATTPLIGTEGHTMVLTVPEVDIELLRTLAYYLRRDITKRLLLLTRTAQKELVESELAEWIDRVKYAADPLVIDGQLALIGGDVTTGSGDFVTSGEAATATEGEAPKCLIIQGAMLSQTDFSLSLYTAWLGDDMETVHAAIDPALAKLRTKAIIGDGLEFRV